MSRNLCKTESELRELVKVCATLKFKTDPSKRVRASRPFMLKVDMNAKNEDDLLEVTNIKQLILHLFREFHQTAYTLTAYPEVKRLSAEFDYLQNKGVWHYVTFNKAKV